MLESRFAATRAVGRGLGLETNATDEHGSIAIALGALGVLARLAPRMRCPFCRGEVDLIAEAHGDSDEPFGRVQCPHPRCARDVVLAVVPLEDATLLDAMAAREAAWRSGRAPPSYLVTSFVVCGLAVCGVMAAVTALPDALLLPIAFLSLVGMAFAPFLIDRVFGTRQWLKALPRRNVKLVARSEGYRA